MNLSELSTEFDVLFEDIATAGSKGLDEYEKSICYTYAQDELIKALALKGDLQDIQDLIKFNSNTTSLSSVYRTGRKYTKVSNSLSDLHYFLKGSDKDIPASVVPPIVIDNMLSAPYQYPPKNLAYVVVGEDDRIVFPPLSFTIDSFVTKYVEIPTPVILEDLSGSLTIRGENSATEPILKDGFQNELTRAAVKFAVDIYIGQQEKEVGNDSQRN